MTLPIDQTVAATFAEHLHSAFRLSDASAMLELELVEVTDASNARQVNFSLLFRGPLRPPLAQQIYPFEHDRLGRFDLFIVPVQRDAHGMYYEAVVNRLIESPPGAHERD